ncbi:MAG: hypothetical protein ABEJ31_09430 [Haloarculaceae archaeon]
MSDAPSDADLARLAADLARSLRDLQRELEPSRRRRFPPTPGDLLRFTDEVAIPGAILVLEANVRALRLLQRAIRLSEPGDSSGSTGADTAVRDRAVDLSRTTLTRLDDALADLQAAVEGRPEDSDARELLAEARDLRTEIDERLARTAAETGQADATDGESDSAVPVDVDAELRSIRDDVDAERRGDSPDEAE